MLEDFVPDLHADSEAASDFAHLTPREQLCDTHSTVVEAPSSHAGEEKIFAAKVPRTVPFRFLEASDVSAPDAALKGWFSKALEQHEENIQRRFDRLSQELRSSFRLCFKEGGVRPSPFCEAEFTDDQPPRMHSHRSSESTPSASSAGRSRNSKEFRNSTRFAPLDLGAHSKDVVGELGLSPGEVADEVVIQDVAAEIEKAGYTSWFKKDRWARGNTASTCSRSNNFAGRRSMSQGLVKMKSAISDVHKPSESPWARNMLRRLNNIAIIVVTLNAGVLFLDLERQGQRIGARIGEIPEDPFGKLDLMFLVLEHLFNVFFVVEFVIRAYVLRSHYLKDAMNVFEACVVVVSCVDLVILSKSSNVFFSRVASASKLARVVRLSRVARVVKELNLLIVTCFNSMRALLWCMVLLVLIMFGSALMVAQMTLLYMTENCTSNSSLCSWTYTNYGSSSRAFWSMFRVTLSGGWPTWADTLIEEVSVWYAVFWFLYIVIVWFAVIRILTALFLKQTMDVANADHETQIAEKLKMKTRFAQKLRKLFEMMDHDGNGMVTLEEFQMLVEDKDARAMMSVLEIDFNEVRELFRMLDDGDGEISFEEFLAGALRVKGAARAIDQVVIMHNQNKLLCHLTKILEELRSSSSGKRH